MRAAGKGRFSGKPDPRAARFSRSVHFDQRLAKHDLEGSRAHATMLGKIGVLTRKEVAAILKGLNRIEREIEAGTFRWKDSLEDVHMNLEAVLTARVPAGGDLAWVYASAAGATGDFGAPFTGLCGDAGEGLREMG